MRLGLAAGAPESFAWTPRKLGAALLNDWDANDAVVTSGKVVSVTDSVAGLAMNDNGQAAQRPTYSMSGPNGHAEITHDGVAQALQTGVAIFTRNPPFTWVIVYKQYGQAAAGTLLSDSGGNALQINASVPSMSFFGGAANNTVAGTPTNLDPAYGALFLEKNGTSTKWYNNGAALTNNATSPGTGAYDMLTVGAYQYDPFLSVPLHCSWTRILLVSGLLSTADRLRLYRYLKRLYGLP